MTCERADDKCESCGKKFKVIQKDAPFGAELRCVDCSLDYFMTWAEEIDFTEDTEIK